MTVQILPSKAKGEVAAPPSKSMGHRYLICAALSEKSTVSGISESADMKATLQCLEKLGATVNQKGNEISLGGLNPFNFIEDTTIDCNESGSTLRFLIPLCLCSNKNIRITGRKRLLERPLQIYEKLCNQKGLTFLKNDEAIIVKGPIKSGNFQIDAGVSSQFVSGLLFALPLLSGQSTLVLNGKIESYSYIELTLKALKDFGVEIIRKEHNVFVIPGNQKYKNRKVEVEGDYSNSAFLEALNLFGGNISVNNLRDDSLQGDRVYQEHFKSLKSENCVIDLADCPDLGPILFAVAAALNGATFLNTSRLRLKESDRCETMRKELLKFGIPLKVEENRVIVPNMALHAPTEKLYGHNDHRVVMSLAVLCSIVGGIIEDAGAVEKSFPDFFQKIASIKIKVEQK